MNPSKRPVQSRAGIHDHSLQSRNGVVYSTQNTTLEEEYSQESQSEDELDSTFNNTESLKDMDHQKINKNQPRDISQAEQKKLYKTYESPKESSNALFVSCCILFIAMVVGVVAGMMYVSQKETTARKNCNYNELKLRHPEQDDILWKSLRVGVELILNKETESPGVYLFVHDGGRRIKDLIKEIAQYSSLCFGQKMQHLEINSDDFTSPEMENDYGYAIEKYKQKIKQGHVILIANLNEIPAKAARALHTICDTYSPISNDVVIFLTLVIQPTDESPVQDAVNTLQGLWGETLNYNELDPVIARVTDQVLRLRT